MIRTLTLAAGLAVAGAANAAFVGGGLIYNAAGSAASSATVNGVSSVFDLVIVFDEADDILNTIGDSSFSTVGGQTLIQTGVFGGVQDVDGDMNPGAFGFVPESRWDTFVALGGPFFGAGNTSTDPDFAFTATGVQGGWFDIPGMGGSRQGVAGNGTDLGGGLWGVFAGQFVINGDFGSGDTGFDSNIILSNIFEGILTVNWIDQAGGPNNGSTVVVGIPAPGAAALFGLAGFTATRRRR